MVADLPWIADVACAAIYLAMAVFVWTRGPAIALNRACAMLIVCFAHWAGCLAVAHHPATSLAVAARAYDVGALAWGSFASLAMWFILTFSRPAWRARRGVIAALIVPPVLVIVAQWSGLLAAGYPHRPWGHAYRWQSSPAAFGFYAYYGVYMLTGLALMIDAARRTGNPIRQRQARLIALPALVPLGLASLTDVWLPRAGIYTLPNIAPDFTLVWVAALVFAIVRYQALPLTPTAAAPRVAATMSEALLLVAPDGRIEWANPAAAAMCGEGEAALRSQPWTRWFGDEALAVGRRDAVVNPTVGAPVPVSLSISLLVDELGQVAGHVVVAADIGARKRAEQALVAARDHLEERVEERTHQLTELNQRLREEMAVRAASEAQLVRSERLASLGLLANGICHEINNPLAAVLANLEAVRVLGGRDRPGNRDELAAATSDAVAAAHRIRTTVRNLRTFARESDELPTIVDVDAVVADALRLLRHELWPRVEFVREAGAALPPVLATPSRLTQVFVNVVMALVGGDAPGGQPVQLRVATHGLAPHVVIGLTAVTGLGVAQRVLASGERPLGLTITHEMVADMGGTLEVSAVAGDEVTVIIRLPACVLDRAAEPEAERPGAAT